MSNNPPDSPWPNGLREFVDQVPWPREADQARINSAQHWFSTWSGLAKATLFCASLPETYCLPATAQMLIISGQLVDHRPSSQDDWPDAAERHDPRRNHGGQLRVEGVKAHAADARWREGHVDDGAEGCQ